MYIKIYKYLTFVGEKLQKKRENVEKKPHFLLTKCSFSPTI
jgi:hypothetical protein